MAVPCVTTRASGEKMPITCGAKRKSRPPVMLIMMRVTTMVLRPTMSSLRAFFSPSALPVSVAAAVLMPSTGI